MHAAVDQREVTTARVEAGEGILAIPPGKSRMKRRQSPGQRRVRIDAEAGAHQVEGVPRPARLRSGFETGDLSDQQRIARAVPDMTQVDAVDVDEHPVAVVLRVLVDVGRTRQPGALAVDHAGDVPVVPIDLAVPVHGIVHVLRADDQLFVLRVAGTHERRDPFVADQDVITAVGRVVALREINQFVQVVLLQVRQYQCGPICTVVVIAVGDIVRRYRQRAVGPMEVDDPGGKRLVLAVIVPAGHRHLFEIICALNSLCRRACRLDRRQQQRDQDPDDGDHDQEFNECKSAFALAEDCW